MSARLNEPIAVIGSACRFAGGANSPSKLKRLLSNPPDLRQEIPPDRFNANAFYHPNGSYHGHTNVRHAYFIEDELAAFDAEFFGTKPIEAKATDPQQRHLMEVTYEALESAGLVIPDLRGSDTAVYVGCMVSDYNTLLLRDLQETPTYYATGTGASILSNRLSYFFDWHGPSVTLDTACSSSLAAVHLAAQTLRSGESRIALASGSNLILGPENFVIESKLKMLSPQGRCRMWDQGADGYARGEGVATLVLKTLSAALEDSDHIECLIRETALNQDGASAGITMPSAMAQESLIRSVYAKAGLNPLSAHDRPQYFEAHGTGTTAGDPQEAEAIYRAFYGNLNSDSEHRAAEPLYVGSIKTILGHTEGTAGIAGILKASLALQSEMIPPNLHFDQLSDQVAPFYKNMEIPTVATPWPTCEGPRRASVNSFGFGGANAHAIVESYKHPASTIAPLDVSDTVFSPFVFSAFSEQSLRQGLEAYLSYLENEPPEISSRDLAWTLRKRRTTFQYRASFAASSLDDLRDRIKAHFRNSSVGVKASILPNKESPKLLGIFTGQGAQYARMGAELIEKSELARTIIEDLESSLGKLPDGPKWSLQAEIIANESSRVYEAAVSQPLCTAVQILLVRLLELAAIKFSAVVGHSSGEIAAAYAAGYLSAHDAIRTAYYRGLHLELAASPNGADIKGAMLAVGSSSKDMQELCADQAFAGRACVAASNSSASVTLSGDEDAINELQLLLNDEKIFNRRLKVDKAYHSDHMLPCFDSYVDSLQRCGITPLYPQDDCLWISSVYNRRVDVDMNLTDKYWAANMTQQVLFSEALYTTLSSDSFDLMLEVGPHAALKGPATQTIEAVLSKPVPYYGTLQRGVGGIEAMSTALGWLWSHLGPVHVKLNSYEDAMSGSKQDHRIVKGLPSYGWTHNYKHWHESRSSRKTRFRKLPVHSLLGDLTPESAPHHIVWKNLLQVSEMEWLSGHQVQNQTVFPASGYLTSALEAAKVLSETSAKSLRLVELRNFVIHQAIAFNENDSGIEVVIEMAKIITDHNRVRASFSYSASLSPQAEDLTLVASCQVEITLGEPSLSLLPARQGEPPHLIDVETNRFYAALADLGYDFKDRFRSLSLLRRQYHRATCLARMSLLEKGADPLLIHPAELDSILQSIILAYSYPYDEQLQTLHLPTSIRHIRVNPALLGPTTRNEDKLFPVDSRIASGKPNESVIIGHVELYSDECSHAAIQVQGAEFMPLGGLAAKQERRVFSKVHWIDSSLDGKEAAQDITLGEPHIEMVKLLERIATFYLRKFEHEVPADSPLRSTFPTNWYLNYAHYVTDMVENGKHKWAAEEWLTDSVDDILEASRSCSHTPDVEIMHLVGTQMPRVFKGETTILEEFRRNDILDRYYANGFGLQESAKWVSRTVKQLADRFPHMKMLEIGAGTGGATKAIFREIGRRFESYTYTDISAAFFENASSIFSQQKDLMIFKTFDAEKDPLTQGYTEYSYDLIVAFFVIHATSDLERALRHIRKLLKPGGRLVVGEGQEGQNGVASSGFIFGTLPGWWLGTDTGRVISPHVSPQEWDALLRKTGFSGVESSTPDSFEEILNVYHFSSQAVDDRVEFYRQPLSSLLGRNNPIYKLVVVGGTTDRSLHLAAGIKSSLEGDFAKTVYSFPTLESIDFGITDADSTVVSLSELDKPVFENITPTAFEALKQLFGTEKTILWITSSRLEDEPFSNMTVGFGRTAQHETQGLRLQQLDVAQPKTTDPNTIAEILLCFHQSAKEKVGIWATPEPEIRIDERGRQLVSRLRPIPELNDRYNSGRQQIIRQRTTTDHPFVIEPSYSGCAMKELSRYSSKACNYSQNDEVIQIKTTLTVPFALKTPIGHKFLAYGRDTKTQTPYLTCLSSLVSVAKVSNEAAAACAEFDGHDEAALIRTTAAHIIAITVLENLFDGHLILVHNADDTFAKAIEHQATVKGVQVVFVTDLSSSEIPDSWIQLPRYLSQAEIEDILPFTPAAFVGFSNHETRISENEEILLSHFGEHCQKIQTRDLFSTTATEYFPSSKAKLKEILSTAVESAQKELRTKHSTSSGTQLVALSELDSNNYPVNPLSIIDWTTTNALPMSVSRLDSEQMFVGENSTYWIVGMTAALGISLADWMISKGARNIVMTSRKPMISQEWIKSYRRKGIVVTILACNVTNEAALEEVYQTIVEKLPPVRGVINGAMVLRDTSILNMSVDDLITVLRPKVDGSIYLDRLFHDVDLDFFVLVSSINCVIGNLGQANYAAANTFMCALAAQRRKRGLRAATVNGGAIVGAGYMERESRRALDMIVQRLNMMRLSEEDWCQTICEAIDASRLDSSIGPELTTGLSDVPFDTPNAPYWFTNPKFSDFIQREKVSSSEPSKGIVTVSVQNRIRDCSSKEQLQEVVKDAFGSQLRNVLQNSTSNEDLMASTGGDLGLDSLVSVDIRSWFLKNLQVNVPVLKIMNNSVVESLVQYAVENIPTELVPQLGDAQNDVEPQSPSSGSGGDVSSILMHSASVNTSTAVTTPLHSPPPEVEPEHKMRVTDIDWETESRPPADFSTVPSIPARAPVNPPRVIVLTGVSGLLGHHLLEYLLNHSGAEKIVCIATRHLTTRLQDEELLRDFRIEYYEGDLAAPLLGLSNDQAESIFAEADTVIHNGADTSHLKYFRDLRAANVGSTTHLIRLCLPRRIPFHYVSSAGVAVLYNKPDFPPVSITGAGSTRPARDGTFGYMCSKWVNERLLEQVHVNHGLPVCIHRPSTIVREGEDATSGRAELDWVHALLSYSRKIGAAPQAEFNRGALDLVYVQSVCKDILMAILGSEPTRKEVTYVHEVGDMVIPMNHLQDIDKDAGATLKLLPMSEWIDTAVAAGLHPAVGALIEMMDSPGAPSYPRLRKG